MAKSSSCQQREKALLLGTLRPSTSSLQVKTSKQFDNVNNIFIMDTNTSSTNSPAPNTASLASCSPLATGIVTTGSNSSISVTSCSNLSKNNSSSPNGSKPSILRSPINRIRRRKRSVETLGGEQISEKSLRDITCPFEVTEGPTKLQPQRWSDDEEKELEDIKIEKQAEDDDKVEVQAQRSSSPRISIVLQHANEVVVEQILPFATNSPPPFSPPNGEKSNMVASSEDHVYRPMNLVSPKSFMSPSVTARNISTVQRKSIINLGNKCRTSKRRPSSFLSMSSSPRQQRRVSFDETTIVKHKRSHRNQKSSFETLRLAMPIILPYFIAVLILVVSSLVPPAAITTTTTTASFKSDNEMFVACTSSTPTPPVRKGFLGRMVQGTNAQSVDFHDPLPAASQGIEEHENKRSSHTDPYSSKVLWTPHSLYGHIVVASRTRPNSRNSI